MILFAGSWCASSSGRPVWLFLRLQPEHVCRSMSGAELWKSWTLLFIVLPRNLSMHKRRPQDNPVCLFTRYQSSLNIENNKVAIWLAQQTNPTPRTLMDAVTPSFEDGLLEAHSRGAAPCASIPASEKVQGLGFSM